MRHVPVVIGVIFAVLFASCLTLHHFGSKLNLESKEYAEATIKNIITDWNARALIDNASIELLETSSPGQLSSFIESWSAKLGRLKHYGGVQGQADLSLSSIYKIVTGRYTAKADFQKGTAEIVLLITKYNKKWHITEFRVNPD